MVAERAGVAPASWTPGAQFPCVEPTTAGGVVPHVKMPAKVWWCLRCDCPRMVWLVSGGLGGLGDVDALADVGQSGGDLGEVELLGLLACQGDQASLEVADTACGVQRVQAVAVGE